ncbi:MAG: methyltransferase domain-containing protein [Anaerolineae bacterium]|nr:methyltransferase domain-containing protein [Anaerolineae bacterium]
MNESDDIYNRILSRYEEGSVPWDNPMPPPEIEALAETLQPGRALDLGCGFGRTAIFLAHRGWSVDGVDFIPQAIEVARERAAEAGVSSRTHFHVGSAAALDFLTPPYDLAVDIGCMHSFTDELLRGYRHELSRLLRPGSLYVLFAHLRDDSAPVEDDSPRGIPEETIMGTLSDDFELERVEHGVTQVKDRPLWNSGWFWFRRR